VDRVGRADTVRYDGRLRSASVNLTWIGLRVSGVIRSRSTAAVMPRRWMWKILIASSGPIVTGCGLNSHPRGAPFQPISPSSTTPLALYTSSPRRRSTQLPGRAAQPQLVWRAASSGFSCGSIHFIVCWFSSASFCGSSS
jgi:hypothetical protein